MVILGLIYGLHNFSMKTSPSAKYSKEVYDEKERRRSKQIGDVSFSKMLLSTIIFAMIFCSYVVLWRILGRMSGFEKTFHMINIITRPPYSLCSISVQVLSK